MTDDEEPLFGIPELDGTLNPSLPPGCLIVVFGTAGASSHLFAKQFAHVGSGASPVLFYTTSERTADAQAAFRAFNWDPDEIRFGNLSDEYYRRVLAPQLEVSRTRERGLRLAEVKNAERPEVAPAPYDIVSQFLNDLAGLDARFRLVLDSLDFLLEVLDLATVMSVVRQIRYRTQLLGGRALVTLQSGVLEGRTTAMLEDVGDLDIVLRAEPNGSAFEHTLEVRKVRNHPERTMTRKLQVSDAGFELAR